jgi:hypothetical protein
MPYTGSTCPESGIYQGTDVCKEKIALSYGERFPPCSKCRQAVNWVLIQSTK